MNPKSLRPITSSKFGRKMSEVADMLGLGPAPSNAAALSLDTLNTRVSVKKFDVRQVKKPKGMSRETFDLLSDQKKLEIAQEQLAGIIDNAPKFKSKLTSALQGKWIWADVPSTARNGDKTPFYHWVKADFHYTDYQYAKFNIKSQLVTYTNEEYDLLLSTAEWSRQDTDLLLSTCAQFDLRWPVIGDRIELSSPKSVEAMRWRYTYVVTKLKDYRSSGSNDTNPDNFSDGHLYDEAVAADKDKIRRIQQDILFKLSKADEKVEWKFLRDIKMSEDWKFLKDIKVNEDKHADQNAKKRKQAGKEREVRGGGWGGSRLFVLSIAYSS